MAASPHVLVIGAGIIGCAIAWHLARAGARVTVVEAEAPGGIATRHSFAWINASRGNPAPYFRLRHQAMAEWRRLEHEVAGVRVAWTGGLLWGPSIEELDAFVAEHARWGYGIRRIGRADVQRLEPQLATPPEHAVHAAEEGAVEPVATTLALLKGAQVLGTIMRTGTPVRHLECRGGRVTGIATGDGRLAADEIVLAAGAGSVALAAAVGCMLPIDNPAALLVLSGPHHARLLNGMVLAPDMDLRQTAEGRIAASAGLRGEQIDGGAAAAAVVFDKLRRLLLGADELALEAYALGHRPIPRSGLPLIGRPGGIDNLYVAVTHSGITLAPAIGRIAAAELLTGHRDPLAEPFRLPQY